MIAPVTLLVTDELEVSPYPFLAAEIFASNVGGTETLIGDPPNIMIGSAMRLIFNDFVLNLAPVTPPILAVTLAVLHFIYGCGRRPETNGAHTSCASGNARRLPTCRC